MSLLLGRLAPAITCTDSKRSSTRSYVFKPLEARGCPGNSMMPALHFSLRLLPHSTTATQRRHTHAAAPLRCCVPLCKCPAYSPATCHCPTAQPHKDQHPATCTHNNLLLQEPQPQACCQLQGTRTCKPLPCCAAHSSHPRRLRV